MAADTWARRLWKSLQPILVWPHWEPYEIRPPLQHKPIGGDDQIEFWTALEYVRDEGTLLYDECMKMRRDVNDGHLTPDEFGAIARELIQALDIPVESQQFWAEWDWPTPVTDILEQWKFDRKLQDIADAYDKEQAA